MTTKKTFLLAAELIAANPCPAKRRELAHSQANLFALDNPRFDRARFLQACNSPR